MPKYAPIAVAGAIAAAVVVTAATSTDANANSPGCRLPHLHRYVACTDQLKARTPIQVRQVLRGGHRPAALGFRRR
jgi:hypothetical protein